MTSRALLLFTLLIFAGIGVFSLLANLVGNLGFLPTVTGLVMAAALALFYSIGRNDGKNDCLLASRPKANPTAAAPTQRQDPRP